MNKICEVCGNIITDKGKKYCAICRDIVAKKRGLEAARRHYYSCTEKCNRYSTQWRKNNPDKIKKHRHKYYITHTASLKRYAIQWRKNNANRTREYKRNYYNAHKKSNKLI